MTLNTILQRPTEYQVPPAMDGEWFVATAALRERSIEELDILNATGALILACRQGFWNEELQKQEVELFLCGTGEQLMAAQERFNLQPLIDAELDRPENNWG